MHIIYNFFMIGYITGMILGSMALIIASLFLFRRLNDLRSKNQLIKRIGTKAEKIINKDIRQWAKFTNNKFIDSGVYKYDYNKIFEVDSILITDKALIIIEIKSIKGIVNGDATKDFWEKINENKTYQIFNVVKQNDKHIAHIIEMLKINVPTISLIVYSDRVDYIEIINQPHHVVITKHNNLFQTLDKINSSLLPKINAQNKKAIYNELNIFKTTKMRDKKLHKNITNNWKGASKWK